METLIERYRALGIAQVLDYDKFNHSAITHHSTAIEGCTLTEVETSVLLHDGLTPQGKPLAHSLMVKDHFAALHYTLETAAQRKPLSLALIQQIAARVLKNTGAVYQTALGQVDASQGELRRGNVYAGESYFPNYDKVPTLMEHLVDCVCRDMQQNLSITQALHLSFDLHFQFVSIHPFYDGNGRTARLLMNYIQHYYNLPLAIVLQQSRASYFQALIDSRKHNNPGIFQAWMAGEYRAQLAREIEKIQRLTQD